MATTLTLVCHGSTRAMRAGAIPMDEPLDSFGERDCARAKDRLRADQVLIAPELRARQTAEALGLAGEIEPALRDADHGSWAGRSPMDLGAEDLRQWLTDPDSAPHGGESFSTVLRRTEEWLDRRGTVKGRLVAVTHPIIVRAAIAYTLGASAAAFQSIDIAPLSAAEFSFSNRWRLRGLAPLAEETASDA